MPLHRHNRQPHRTDSGSPQPKPPQEFGCGFPTQGEFRTADKGYAIPRYPGQPMMYQQQGFNPAPMIGQPLGGQVYRYPAGGPAVNLIPGPNWMPVAAGGYPPPMAVGGSPFALGGNQRLSPLVDQQQLPQAWQQPQLARPAIRPQQQVQGGNRLLGKIVHWLVATDDGDADPTGDEVSFTATANGNMCCSTLNRPGWQQPAENTNNVNYRVAKLLRIVPQSNPQDALHALQKFNGNLDDAAGYLVDVQTQKAAATDQAQALCNTVYQFFPQEEGGIGSSSYYDWATQANQLNCTMAAAHAVAPIVDQLEAKVRPTGRKKALLIGCRYTGSRQQLSGPVQDVDRVKKFLTTVYGFKDTPTTMVTLVDDDTNLRDSKRKMFVPTKRNILNALWWLATDLRAGDAVFFYYSGHGSQKASPQGYLYESDGLDETILPVDFKEAGHIVDEDLAERFARMPAGVRAICMMDCCHSGTGMDLPFSTNFQTGEWKSNRTKLRFLADVTLISGCRSDQTSADLSMQSRKAGGAMTLAWLAICAQKPFSLTFRSMLRQMGSILSDRGFTQIIEISSTIPFDLRRRLFAFDDILNVER